MAFYSSYDSYIVKDRYISYSGFSNTNKSFASYDSSFTDYFNPTSSYNDNSTLNGFYSYFTGDKPLDTGYFYNSNLYSSSSPVVTGGYSYSFPNLNSSNWFKGYNTDFSIPTVGYSSLSYGGVLNPVKSLLPASNSYDFSTLGSYSGSLYTPSKTYSASNSSLKSSGSNKPLKYSYSAVNQDVQAKLGPEFLAKVKEVANNINCDYKDLLAVMNAESGLNPAKQNNAGHQMYGLIQFSADSARLVGSTHAKLVRMSAVEQMDYVEKYYKHWIKAKGWQGKRLSAADLYALTLAPGKAENDVLYTQSANKKQYIANKGIDTNFGNGDGKIDKRDCEAFIASKRVNESIFA